MSIQGSPIAGSVAQAAVRAREAAMTKAGQAAEQQHVRLRVEKTFESRMREIDEGQEAAARQEIDPDQRRDRDPDQHDRQDAFEHTDADDEAASPDEGPDRTIIGNDPAMTPLSPHTQGGIMPGRYPLTQPTPPEPTPQAPSAKTVKKHPGHDPGRANPTDDDASPPSRLDLTV